MLKVILEPVSNRQDWIDQCEVRDEDNELVDLTDATIVFEVRNRQTKASALTATTDDDTITIESAGIFEFTFPLADMRTLCPETYDVGCTIEINDVTQQFFVGTVAVVDGIVS